ncbi:hypothetical protein Tco_0422625 [Tanacetum coccineum]
MKRFKDLKDEQEKSEQELRKLLNPATLKAQAQKWTEHEAKKAKMMEEYNHQISFRADPLPITKSTMLLKMLGFSEWLEVHALASKKYGTSNNLLLQTLRAKFQWVLNQEKRLGLPPPPELATFGLTAEEKKRKRTEFFKEVFVTEDVRVDGIERNLIPPHGVMPIQGLVINEPESRIFLMNGNTDIGFQRESEFHLTPTTELIRLQKQIKVDSVIAKEMFLRMNFVIEARKIRLSVEEPLSAGLRGEEVQLSVKHQLAVKGLSECKASESNIRRIQVIDIVKKVEDYLKT